MRYVYTSDVQTTFLESATNELEAAHRAKLQALMTTMQVRAEKSIEIL